MSYFMLFESPGPEFQAAGRNRIADLRSHPRTGPAIHYALPGKERKDSARHAVLVAIVKMVSSGVVEIHRPFDHAQSQDPGVKIVIALRVTRDGRDMMYTLYVVIFHFFSFDLRCLRSRFPATRCHRRNGG